MRAQPNFKRLLHPLLLLVCGTGLIVVIAERLLSTGPVPAPVSPNESDIAGYVGNEACRRCHVKEFHQVQASDHAKTLRPMSRAALGSLCPSPGRINNSQYALVEKDGAFYFEVNVPTMPDKYQLWPIDYAFGSGHSGISFVSMLEGRNAVEMKMSYFPHSDKWALTPGQKLDNPAAAGNLGNLQQSRRCLGCHVIALSRNTFVPRREFFGVGCESCHGPGRPHLEAVNAHAADLKMAHLRGQGAVILNTLCGKCHQTAKDVEASPAMAKMTYRFQPYGLMKSHCFLESGDRLSCMSCHDAHAEVSADQAAYVRACLSCHSATGTSAGNRQTGKRFGNPCPVNAASDCIRCHMPRRDVLSATHETSGVLLTEHRIGIYKDAPSGSTSSSSTL